MSEHSLVQWIATFDALVWDFDEGEGGEAVMPNCCVIVDVCQCDQCRTAADLLLKNRSLRRPTSLLNKRDC